MGSEQLTVIKEDDGMYTVAPRYKPAGTRVVDNFGGVIFEILNYAPPIFLPETNLVMSGLSKEEESVIRELKVILNNTSDEVRRKAVGQGRESLEWGVEV